MGPWTLVVPREVHWALCVVGSTWRATCSPSCRFCLKEGASAGAVSQVSACLSPAAPGSLLCRVLVPPCLLTACQQGPCACPRVELCVWTLPAALGPLITSPVLSALVLRLQGGQRGTARPVPPTPGP